MLFIKSDIAQPYAGKGCSLRGFRSDVERRKDFRPLTAPLLHLYRLQKASRQDCPRLGSHYLLQSIRAPALEQVGSGMHLGKR